MTGGDNREIELRKKLEAADTPEERTKILEEAGMQELSDEDLDGIVGGCSIQYKPPNE
jgi:hypothetical protein